MSFLAAALVAVSLAFHPHHHHRGHYPRWWLRQAACIRHYESNNEWHINTGNGYYGAYQFLLGTWAAYAPPKWTRWPNLATPAEQTFVAWRTWEANGRSWYGQWGTARLCA